MFVSFTFDELSAAPPEVQAWVSSRFLLPAVKSAVVVNAKPEAPGLTHDEVKAAAVSLAERKGTDAVLSILKNMGIRRVADCPKDRLSELLEAIQGA